MFLAPLQSCHWFSSAKTEIKCDHHNPNRSAWFGDTHVHTHLSFDARSQGTIATHEDAYAFAKGQRIGITPYDKDGNPLRTFQLDQPLDFVAISDHAEYLGAVDACFDSESKAYSHSLCIILRDISGGTSTLGNFGADLYVGPRSTAYPELCGPDGEECIMRGIGIWTDIVEKANAAQDTSSNCSFTAFPAYEWTGTPVGNNLHRNVIFKNGIVPDRPVSYLDAPWVEDLWAELRKTCMDADKECDVLTIPHNSNISDSLMFKNEMKNGQPFDQEYMEERRMMEPLIEVYQHKGNSECISGDPIVDPNCDFELVNYNNFLESVIGGSEPPKADNFIRYALTRGLKHQQDDGVNPFKHGIIASTDTHLAIPGGVDEERFPGHGGAGQANTDVADAESVIAGLVDTPFNSAGGLAAVWAEQNSRDSIFEAMKRRETFGTSGPRIKVRFFGGWGYPADICTSLDPIGAGYDRGVPMGGDLPAATSGQPTFFVQAQQAQSTSIRPAVPLQSVQIVKGWYTASGTLKTKVIDLEGSALLPTTGPIDACVYPTEGLSEVCYFWQDPEFDLSQQAYYYARVLEAPTCRWTTHACLSRGYDCQDSKTELDNACCDPVLGLNRNMCTNDLDCSDPDSLNPQQAQCCLQQVQPLVQERAWTSPIWHVPASK